MLESFTGPLLKFLMFVLFLVVCLAVFLYCIQDKLIYIPVIPPLDVGMSKNPSGMISPIEHNLPYDDLTIKTSDGITIRGWRLLQENARSSPTIIFFHENAGNIGTRLPYAAEIYRRLGCNFVMVAYRGYSESEGVPSEKGLMNDGHAIMEEVLGMKDIDQDQIFVHGRSLGGAVATYVTTSRNYKISGVILENTFTSISAMVDKIFPGVAFLKDLVLRNYWANDKRVEKLDVPVLFIKSELDEIVPPSHMDVLYDLCQSRKKEKFMIKGAGHNGGWAVDPDTYFEELKGFMKSCKETSSFFSGEGRTLG